MLISIVYSGTVIYRTTKKVLAQGFALDFVKMTQKCQFVCVFKQLYLCLKFVLFLQLPKPKILRTQVSIPAQYCTVRAQFFATRAHRWSPTPTPSHRGAGMTLAHIFPTHPNIPLYTPWTCRPIFRGGLWWASLRQPPSEPWTVDTVPGQVWRRGLFFENYYWGRILSGDRICHDAWFEAAFLIGSNPWDWGILRVDSDHSSWCLSRGTFCLFGPWGNAVFLVPRQPRFLYPVPVLQAASRRPTVATLPTSPLSSLEWRVGGRCGNCHLGMPRKKDKTW